MKCLSIAVLALLAGNFAYAGDPPPDYPFRVKAVRLHTYPAGDSGLGADAPEGRGYAVLLDLSGAVAALQFNFYDTGCFYHPKDLYFQTGGFYPARWVKGNEIALATDVSGAGRVHECRFKVKRMAVPDTKDYRELKAMGPADMAKVYQRTSVTNPPAHPLVPGKPPGSWVPPQPPRGYDASSDMPLVPVPLAPR